MWQKNMKCGRLEVWSKKMPKALLDFMGFKFFFWSNEEKRMHIHVCKGDPRPNATKFWVTADEVELAYNDDSISAEDLNKIKKYIYANRNTIIARWVKYFGL